MPKLTARQKQKREIFLYLLTDTRERAKLTQVQLAAKLNRPQSYVSKVESGEREMDWFEVADFCTACGYWATSFANGINIELHNRAKAKKRKSAPREEEDEG